MVYRVRLYRNKMLPYEIDVICADNKKEAEIKAKEQIAKNGYWENESMTVEERIKLLTIESVTLDNY